MLRKLIQLIYGIKGLFTRKGRRPAKGEKELEVPDERYTLW